MNTDELQADELQATELSALVDEELDVETRDRLLDELGHNPNARRTWGRYHLVGEVLRGSGSIEAVGETDSAEVIDLPPRRDWRLPLAGFAIAASVCALTVVLVTNNQRSADPVQVEIAARATADPVPAEPLPVQAPSATVTPEVRFVPASAYDQRLNGYLVNFNEQRTRLGVPGVHPYVRIVGFESE